MEWDISAASDRFSRQPPRDRRLEREEVGQRRMWPATRTVADGGPRVSPTASTGGVCLVREYANGCRCTTVPTPLRDLGLGGRDGHRVVRLLPVRRPGRVLLHPVLPA